MVRTFSAVPWGVDGVLVQVEAGRVSAPPKIQVTGLAGDVVRESCDRIRACLVGHGFEVPSDRVVVHLGPAEQPKQGSQLDLAMALAILGAEGMLGGIALSRYAFLGELGMDGRLRPLVGSVGLIEAVLAHEPPLTCIVPAANERDAGLFPPDRIRLAVSLREVLAFLTGQGPLAQAPLTQPNRPGVGMIPGLDSVRGQPAAKRALTLALAGGHHLLLVGSPGVGKSLLGNAAESLLPPLTRGEWIDVLKSGGAADRRPFRAPHHSLSAAALLGGGSGCVMLGEVTRAHRGVLFLDELPEFRRDALEGLREPLENGFLNIHRVGRSLRLPAEFLLIAAMNPCPCGFALSSSKRCRCRWDKAEAYRKRLSGPFLDRIDLCVVMQEADPSADSGFSEKEARAVIERVRDKTLETRRWGVRPGVLPDPCRDGPHRLSVSDWSWLQGLVEREGMSFRGIHKLLRVARTIADTEESDAITREHLAEAWIFRCPGAWANASR